MLALETDDRQACELVAKAIGAINTYKHTQVTDLLETALSDLRLARRHDEQYLLAPYYIAVVEDLLGRPRDAAEQLQLVLSEAPTRFPELINEIRFNLAIAQFHGYSHEHLAAAAATLEAILKDTQSRRFKFFRVRLHSRALLARVNSMWSIPRNPHDVLAESERDRITKCYKSALRNARSVLRSPMLLALRIRERKRAREIEAIARNAIGTAEMYYSDYFFNKTKKLQALRRGLSQLTASDRQFPRDWASYCNIASCHMRIAFWTNDPREYTQARSLLTEVVRELRPNYGFALYEIGRSYRLEGRFDMAVDYLSQAKAIPERHRNVSDRRVDRELGLATDKSTSYP